MNEYARTLTVPEFEPGVIRNRASIMCFCCTLVTLFFFFFLTVDPATAVTEDEVTGGKNSAQATGVESEAPVKKPQTRRQKRLEKFHELEREEARIKRKLLARQHLLIAALDMQDQAQVRYSDALTALQNHLVAIYKKGETDTFAMLLATRSADEAVDTVELAAQITEHDRKIVNEYFEAKDKADEIAIKVELENEKVAEAESSLSELNGELETLEDLLRGKTRSGRPVNAKNFFFTDSAEALDSADSLNLNAISAGAVDDSVATDTQTQPDDLEPTGDVEVGLASWYGAEFHGQPTANGETFDMFAMTAAHRTLPMGTWVRVTLAETGNSIVVRINDRGPYVDGRIIDLSYMASTTLGMDSVEEVMIEVLKSPSESGK